MGLNGVRRRSRALWLLMLLGLAGAINAGGMLSYGHTISHMTGNLTKLGTAMAITGEDVLLLAAMLVCFIFGSTLSGLAFPQHTARRWKRCGAVLMACGGTILVSEWLPVRDEVRVCVLAFTMGAQNGLAVRYRGILARTTHVTGHLTDCGAALGRMLLNSGQRRAELRLFAFHLSCVLAFLLGVLLTAWLGPLLRSAAGISVMQLAVVLYVGAGAATWRMGQRDLLMGAAKGAHT